jgi:polyisoprenoid-binding protein YceI
MKTIKIFPFLIFALVWNDYLAQDKYTLSKEFSVLIKGTSNLHDWSETVAKANGSGSVKWNSDGTADLNEIALTLDVNSIKSESSVMDNNTYKALKAKQDPEISFTLTAPVKSIRTSPGGTTISAIGNMTIAGVTKVVTLIVKVSLVERGKMVFEGSKQINMTDYGITPPVALFGALKTGDQLTLSFSTTYILNNN